jgi:hypothetical protein
MASRTLMIEQPLPDCTADEFQLLDYVVKSSIAVDMRDPCSPLAIMLRQLGELFGNPVPLGQEHIIYADWLSERRRQHKSSFPAASAELKFAVDVGIVRRIIMHAIIAIDRKSRQSPHPYYRSPNR